MKKIFKTAAVLLVMLTALVTFASCKKPVSDISVKEMPQSVYVVGQPLKLDDGVLLVKRDTETEEIAMNAEGVTVSGYDANTVGTQTLTVTYEEKSTEMKVKVVNRVSASNFAPEYLVGDELDASKGILTVTRDDGTSFTVNLNDPAVSLSFDSSATGEAVPVSVRYQDATLGECTGTFSVTVYQPEVTLKKPNKIAYKSYETELDLTGGYLTLSAGSIQRYVQLTDPAVTVTPLDTSLASGENTSVQQTLTIQYGDIQHSFEVTITYSTVTLFRENAATLLTYGNSLNWTGDTVPEVSEQMGELALDSMHIYYAMPDAEKQIISSDDAAAVAKIAAVYGYAKWETAVSAFSETFTLSHKEGDNAPTLTLVCSSYEAVKADYALLQNQDSDLYALANLLIDLSVDFADCKLGNEKTIVEYLLYVYDPAGLETLCKQLALMLELYEGIQSVPAEWTVEGLKTYNDLIVADAALMINAANKTLITSPVTDGYGKNLCTYVLTWRNDFFDILYSHYFYNLEDRQTIVDMENVCRYNTRPLRVITNLVNLAGEQILLMQKNVPNGASFDTSKFMYYYSYVLKYRSELANSSDDLSKWLYNVLSFDSYLALLVSPTSGSVFQYDYYCGYNDICYALYGDSEFQALWDEYLVIYELYLYDTSKCYDSEAFQKGVQKLLNDYLAMSPAKQFGFLNSLNLQYRYTPTLMLMELSSENLVNSYFAMFLLNTYSRFFKEDSSSEVFQNLLAAAEYYAKSDVVSFLTAMGKVETGYAAMTDADDKALIADFYNQFHTYYARYDAEGKYQDYTLSAEWQKEFDALQKELENFTAVMTQMKTLRQYYENGMIQTLYQPYAALIATYESAAEIANRILASDDPAVLQAYYSRRDDSGHTLDYYMLFARYQYVYFLTNLKIGNYVVWNLYHSSGLEEFMADAAGLMQAYLRVYFNVDETFTFSADELVALMASYRNLNGYQQMLFRQLSTLGNMYPYYRAIQAFINQNLTENAATVAKDLWSAVEWSYTDYLYWTMYPSYETEIASAKTSFVSAFEKMQSAYEALSETDKASFNQYFKTVYEYYASIYKTLVSATESSAA